MADLDTVFREGIQRVQLSALRAAISAIQGTRLHMSDVVPDPDKVEYRKGVLDGLQAAEDAVQRIAALIEEEPHG